MKPRRTWFTNRVFRLPGGNEDNDLWTYQTETEDGHVVTCSVWEPTPEERIKLMNGECVRLIVWGQGMPPVAIDTTDEPLGRPPRDGA